LAGVSSIGRSGPLQRRDGTGVRRHDERPDNPDADFARAKPFKELFPKQHKSWKKTGRPPVETPKVHIGFRLAADVVNAIRATGRGYNAGVEKVLREALAKGRL
jgi:uncharacterized protein (DUF4415 family)